jgi:hypothetical protein
VQHQNHLRVVQLLARACKTVVVSWFDVSAATIHPLPLLDQLCDSPLLPPFQSLLAVHAIHDSDTGSVWLHTHGLRRFSSQAHAHELECFINDVTLAEGWAKVLNTVAGAILSQGYDGPLGGWVVQSSDTGIFEFLKVEDNNYARTMSKTAPGGAQDRATHVNGHSLQVVRLPRSQNISWHNGVSFVEIARGDTSIHQLLVLDMMPLFSRLFSKFGGVDAWEFQLKVGVSIEGDAEDASEHLWCNVKSLDVGLGRLEVVVACKPLHVTHLDEGDNLVPPLSTITGLSITVSQYGSFDSVSICRLVPFLQ